MIVRGLTLENFRNIERANLSFSPTFNVVKGRNAQGKTNLLEAIHLFSLGRSFRTRSAADMIMFGREYSVLKMTGRSDGGVEVRIDIVLERRGKPRASINGKRIAGLSGVIGVVPSVIFTPEDVALTSGPPGNRRSYLDYTAAQISPVFLSNIKEYRRVLKQRNGLLKRAAEGDAISASLDPWDDMLSDRGAAIVAERRATLRVIAEKAEELFGAVAPGGGDLESEYLCSFDPDGEDPRKALAEALARVRELEIRRGYTLAGPHYDDIAVRLDGADLRRFGSQGRKRAAAIALKLAQAFVIMENRPERPVVLLDDIFSELDDVTASRARDLLSDRYQSLITSPRSSETAVGAVTLLVEEGEFRSEE